MKFGFYSRRDQRCCCLQKIYTRRLQGSFLAFVVNVSIQMKALIPGNRYHCLLTSGVLFGDAFEALHDLTITSSMYETQRCRFWNCELLTSSECISFKIVSSKGRSRRQFDRILMSLWILFPRKCWVCWQLNRVQVQGKPGREKRVLISYICI